MSGAILTYYPHFTVATETRGAAPKQMLQLSFRLCWPLVHFYFWSSAQTSGGEVPPTLECLWVALRALSQICGIVQILLDTFSELQFNICHVINACICFVSLSINLRAGTLFYRDNGFVFSATKGTQRWQGLALGWGQGCSVRLLFLMQSQGQTLHMFPSFTPSSLLPSKTGSPLQHSAWNWPVLTPFSVYPNPAWSQLFLHSLFSPVLVIFLFI